MIGFKSIRGTAQIQILRSTNNASFAAVGFLISFDSTVLHTSVRNTGSSVRSEIWQTVSMETHLALVPAGNRLTALMSSCRSSSFQPLLLSPPPPALVCSAPRTTCCACISTSFSFCIWTFTSCTCNTQSRLQPQKQNLGATYTTIQKCGLLLNTFKFIKNNSEVIYNVAKDLDWK